MAIADIRVAQVMNADLPLTEFLRQKYKQCPKCQNTVLRDWGEIDSSPRCNYCQFDMGATEDEWEVWRRKQQANQTRRRLRKEILDYQQMSFDDYLEFIEDETNPDLPTETADE